MYEPPLGLMGEKKKKTNGKTGVRYVAGCSTCKGTFTSILQESRVSQFQKQPSNKTRGEYVSGESMHTMAPDKQSQLTLEETILLSQNFCATYASVSETGRCPTTTVRVPTRFSSPAHCQGNQERKKLASSSKKSNICINSFQLLNAPCCLLEIRQLEP